MLPVAALAGCAGGGAPLVASLSSPPNSTLQNAVVSFFTARKAVTVIRTDHRKSWIDPDAKKGELLYISDAGTNDVIVYRYPSGVEAGVLTGFDEPQGECVDKAGNVWIANTLKSNLLEYAHGGTTRIATLSDSGQYPAGCSVSKADGTLAASNITSKNKKDDQGSLSIYTQAMGEAKIISSPSFQYVYFLGYDNKGNLFLDGYDPNKAAQFGELPAGSGTITPIALSGATLSFPGGVQVAQSRVNVGDQGHAVIYRARENGKVTASTPLDDSADCVQFFIRGKTVICPDAGNGSIEFYQFPGGGSPTLVIPGLAAPTGAAVSAP